MSNIFVDLGIDIDPVEYAAKIIRDYQDALADERMYYQQRVKTITSHHELVMKRIRNQVKLNDVDWDKFIKLVIKRAGEL